MIITKDNLKIVIRTNKLDQLIDGDDTILEQAITRAEAHIQDVLFQRYDWNLIQAQKPENVKTWVMYITMYFIYERIPEEAVPDRVVKNYTETMDFLDKIAQGKVSVNLPYKTEETSTGVQPSTKFLWGSLPSRSH